MQVTGCGLRTCSSGVGFHRRPLMVSMAGARSKSAYRALRSLGGGAVVRYESRIPVPGAVESEARQAGYKTGARAFCDVGDCPAKSKYRWLVKGGTGGPPNHC